jgi:hypothetical protein
MRKLILALVPLLLSCACAQAKDEFAKLRCGMDIPKALIGRRESDSPIVKTEAKYKSLGLRHLGADIVADDMNTISWRICGKEFMVLDKRSTVADVIEFPPHSRSSPPFSGACQIKGRETKDMIVAVLDDASGKGDLLPAKAAWRIDEKAAKLVKMETSDLLCPRSGVYYPTDEAK